MPLLQTKAEGPPLIACAELFFSIYSQLPIMSAGRLQPRIFKTRHTAATRDPLKHVFVSLRIQSDAVIQAPGHCLTI
jgi:hypothetical protein